MVSLEALNFDDMGSSPIPATCVICGVKVHRRPSKIGRNVTCSRSCSNKARRGIRYKNTNNTGWREYALNNLPNVCIRCGYDEDKRMLDVDHINGRVNNDLSNLRILCVWCHALRTRQVESF